MEYASVLTLYSAQVYFKWPQWCGLWPCPHPFSLFTVSYFVILHKFVMACVTEVCVYKTKQQHWVHHLLLGHKKNYIKWGSLSSWSAHRKKKQYCCG